MRSSLTIPVAHDEHLALRKIRRRIERLGPYQSLLLLAVPTGIVEPLKLVAVAIAGKGHWISGTLVIVFAYAVSLIVVEWLFAVVKPKLMTLGWFARTWTWIVNVRVVRWLGATKDRILGWVSSAVRVQP